MEPTKVIVFLIVHGRIEMKRNSSDYHATVINKKR